MVLLFLNARTRVTELKAIGAHEIHVLVFNCPQINCFLRVFTV